MKFMVLITELFSPLINRVIKSKFYEKLCYLFFNNGIIYNTGGRKWKIR
jgi:hypothetical protein